jgi:phosphonoacetaldehyde hydrolase
MTIRLVVFDWAGTVIDFGCFAPVEAFRSVFAQVGVPVSVAEARGPMGLHKKDHLRAMLGAPALAQRWAQTMGRPPEEADVEDLYRLVTPLQVNAAARHDDLVPGCVSCVTRLRRAGIAIGATTGYFREAAAAVYEAAARHGFVPDVSVGADEVSQGRPAPFMLFRVMEATGVYPATQVAKVGDTVQDIAEGRNAGAWSVGVVDSSSAMGLTLAEFQTLSTAERAGRREAVSQELLAAGAHAVILSLEELPDLVAGLAT